MKLKNLVPQRLRHRARRARDLIRDWRTRVARVTHRSRAENVYHCCAHKTGSQWLRRLFEDLRTYRYSGLTAYNYQTAKMKGFDERPIHERRFDEPFPGRTIVTPLYIDYAAYRAMPKPDAHRAFYVMRDPRDVTVSWYFSMKLSHGLMGNLPEVKQALDRLDETAGLGYVIDHLDRFGAYAALGSWVDAAETDDNVMLVAFEELTSTQSAGLFRRLFDHLDIAIPDDVLRELLDDYSFERLSGRARGEEDRRSHYRKGVAGDWRNHFGETVRQKFAEVTGDLVSRMGYE